MFTCPACGNHDKFENVMASVQSFIKEATSRYLDKSLRQTLRGSKHLKITSKPVKQGQHRFIVDFQL